MSNSLRGPKNNNYTWKLKIQISINHKIKFQSVKINPLTYSGIICQAESWYFENLIFKNINQILMIWAESSANLNYFNQQTGFIRIYKQITFYSREKTKKPPGQVWKRTIMPHPHKENTKIANRKHEKI